MSSVDIETVLQQAKTDALYIRDSLTSAFEDRCTFGDCKDLHFSACHSEFLDAECIGESPLLGQCIDVSCQEVRDYTYAAVQLPREDLDGEDKNPTDLDVIETVCYGTSLDIPLRDSFNGVRSTADVNRVFTYFGSWNGVMRIFPGGSYDRECGEYDPRVRPWYVTASSGPKDVVILMDSSNSMRNGDYFDLAKSAVIAVLNTMNEQTFVNVVTFSDKATVLEGDKLISATSDNKDLLTSKLEDVSAVGASNFEEAFEVAFQLLETSRADAASSSQCSSAIIMLSDSGEGEDDQELRTFVQSKNENISAQIFTFALAGNDSSPELMKNIACDNGGIHQQISDDGAELSKAMSFYHRYYAIGLGDGTNDTTYSSIYEFATGGITGFTVASPAYSAESDPPSFLGVAGVDFSLQSFLDLGFTEEEVQNALRSEGNSCPDFSADACQLQRFRFSIGTDSVCPSPDNCTLNGTSVFPVRCSEADYPSNIWDNTRLDGLSFEERNCCEEDASDSTTVEVCENFGDGQRQDDTTTIIITACVGLVVVVGFAILIWCRLRPRKVDGKESHVSSMDDPKPEGPEFYSGKDENPNQHVLVEGSSDSGTLSANP